MLANINVKPAIRIGVNLLPKQKIINTHNHKRKIFYTTNSGKNQRKLLNKEKYALPNNIYMIDPFILSNSKIITLLVQLRGGE